MNTTIRLSRNALITYGMMGIINYLGVRNQLSDPLDADPAKYLFLWPISRINRFSPLNSSISFIGITILQLFVLLIYFISSFIILALQAGRRAEEEAQEYLVHEEFRKLLDHYLYQKRDVIEQYPKLTTRNFTRLMDELINRDLIKLHEILVYRDFRISRLGLLKALKIQGKPIYSMMLQELKLIEKRHLEPDLLYHEISPDEIEKLR